MTHPPSKNKYPPGPDRLIRNVIVHRKDIEVLLRAIRARGLEVVLYARGEKCRGLDEVVRVHGAHLNDLELHGYNKKLGSVSVLLQNGHALIHAEGSFVSKELQHELTLFLNTRRSLKKRIFSWGGWRLLSIAAFVAEFILLFIEPVRGQIPYRLHLYLWIAVFLWPVSRVMAPFLHPFEIESPKLLSARHR
jgi:hypothetical protein